MIFLKILIIIGVVITIGILFAGVTSMGRGGKDNQKKGNFLMRARVISQFVTVLLIVLYWWLNN